MDVLIGHFLDNTHVYLCLHMHICMHVHTYSNGHQVNDKIQCVNFESKLNALRKEGKYFYVFF